MKRHFAGRHCSGLGLPYAAGGTIGTLLRVKRRQRDSVLLKPLLWCPETCLEPARLAPVRQTRRNHMKVKQAMIAAAIAFALSGGAAFAQAGGGNAGGGAAGGGSSGGGNPAVANSTTTSMGAAKTRGDAPPQPRNTQTLTGTSTSGTTTSVPGTARPSTQPAR